MKDSLRPGLIADVSFVRLSAVDSCFAISPKVNASGPVSE
jgi:hypothetical protein